MAEMFGPAAADKIIRSVRKTLRNESYTEGDTPSARGLQLFEGETTTTLSATTNGKTNPTTCKVKAYVPIPGDDHDPPHFQLGETEFTLVNRSKTMPQVPAGTYVIFARVRNEWRIIWADC